MLIKVVTAKNSGRIVWLFDIGYPFSLVVLSVKDGASMVRVYDKLMNPLQGSYKFHPAVTIYVTAVQCLYRLSALNLGVKRIGAHLAQT